MWPGSGSSGEEDEGEDDDPAAAVFRQGRLHLGGRLLLIFPGALLLLVRVPLMLLVALLMLPLVFVAARSGRRSCVVLLLQITCRAILFVLGFWRITTSGERSDVPDEGCMLVANHAGGVDVLWMLYDYGTAFVAKAAMKKAPLFGDVAEQIGCIFVERTAQGGSNTSEEILKYFEEKRSRASREEGKRLCIFPEGTSTNGNGVIEFHTGAFLPPVTVLPLAISLPFSEGWQADPHLSVVKGWQYALTLLCQIANHMHVEYLPPQTFDAAATPKQRAAIARRSIAEALEVPLVDVSYKDKLAYEERIGFIKR